MTHQEVEDHIELILDADTGADCTVLVDELLAHDQAQRALLAQKYEEIAHLRLEAQLHAQEARTANATIAEIYQVVSGATGEPGNWHGAEPVRTRLNQLRADLAILQATVAQKDEEIKHLNSSYDADMLDWKGQIEKLQVDLDQTKLELASSQHAYTLLEDRRAQLQADLDRVMGEAVWAMRFIVWV